MRILNITAQKHDMRNNYIKQQIAALDRIFALQEAQASRIADIFGIPKNAITLVGAGYNSDIFSDRKQSQMMGSVICFLPESLQRKRAYSVS